MNVLHISSSDIKGGAARATYRLHQGLCSYGINSGMLVEKKVSNDETVVPYSSTLRSKKHLWSFLRKQEIKRAYNKYKKSRPSGLELFSDARARYDDSFQNYLAGNDVIHLHWVAGFLDYEVFFPQLPTRKPVVWTLHDMNPFTGGCHYSGDCHEFVKKCGSCPQLGSQEENDLSRSNWIKKYSALVHNNKASLLHIVTPSKWLAKKARESSLFYNLPISVIPNGINTDLFRPRDACRFREELGIPSDATIVGFVADTTANKRKGFNYLKEAVEKINKKNIYLVSVGKRSPIISNKISHIHLGNINQDNLLSLAYSLFDVYVCASVEDNLPNTVIESLSCGTPVVGFNIGGMADMVVPGHTGLLASDVSAESLAGSLYEMLGNRGELKKMAAECRKKALAEYDSHIQAMRYKDLYTSLLKNI